MEDKTYRHNIAVMRDAFDQLKMQRTAFNEARGDGERIAVLEKVVTYASMLQFAASWTLAQIQYPLSAADQSDGENPQV